MRTWRAHLAGADPERSRWTLSPEDSAHLTRVLRLHVGDRVGVFDGRGREWDTEILEDSREGVVVRPGALRRDRVDPTLSVTLFQGACRPDRFEWVLQKGTEIGVARFVPVRTDRTERSHREPRRDRLERILIESCKQCGRRTVPELANAVDLRDVRPRDGAWAAVLAGPAAPPIGTLFAGARPESVDLVVGPESGLDSTEIASLEAGGWTAVSLGPRTLRTETAGVVAAALALHAGGDLGSTPFP